MLSYPRRPPMDATKIDYYKKQIARQKKSTSYTDWAMQRIYKQIVEKYDKQQH